MRKGFSTLFLFSLIISLCGLSISSNGHSHFYQLYSNLTFLNNQGFNKNPIVDDVAISRIVSPESSQIPSCQNLDSFEVKVEIENIGSTRQGNFPVSVLLNNGSVNTIQFTDTLELNEKQILTFPVIADLSLGNSHDFKTWTDLPSDLNRLNDSSTSIISIYTGQSANLPLFENFDQFSLCPTTTNCEATNCDLSSGWENISNILGDDIDWRTNTGGTTSGGTGPTSDHTSGLGNYLYLEASGNPICSNKTAILISPCLNLNFTQQPELNFWYHMLGAGIGELHVDILSNGLWLNDFSSPIIGQQGALWEQKVVDLSQFIGQTINIRLRGITGTDFTSDIAIDDISIKDNFVSAIDASMVEILSPNFNTKRDCLLEDSLEVKVIIRNSGANGIGNLPMKFSINNGPSISGIFNAVIQPNQVVTFTFSSALHLPGAGAYNLKVWQDYAPDQNPGNDTISTSITITPGSIVSIPYNQTFDAFPNCAITTNCEATVCNLMGGWTNYTNLMDDDIDWRVNSGPTASQGTGPPNDQNLGTSIGKYLYLEVSNGCNNKVAILESPCIDLGNAYSPELSVWYHMNGQDMGELHFDVFLGDRWFNDFVPPIIGDQQNSWQQWNIDLSLIAGNIVLVRFRGISDVGFGGDMAIDNISVNDNFSNAQANFNYTQPNCSGQNIVFTDNSIGSGLNHFWNFGQNATPATAIGVGPHNVSYLSKGQKTVQLVVNNVAGSDTNTQNLLIDTLPEVNFNWNINLDTVSFLNQSSNATTYSWNFGDGNTDNSFQPVHVYSSPGIYTVTLTVSNVCGVNVISKDVTIIPTSLMDKDDNHIKIYPNPTSDVFTINAKNIYEKNLQVQILTSGGVIIREYDILINDKELNYTIRMEELNSGIYTIRLIGKSFVHFYKLSYISN